MASIDGGYNHQAHLIDETSLEECFVDVAASFEQQGADSEAVSKLVYGVGGAYTGLSRNNE